jgi:exosortase
MGAGSPGLSGTRSIAFDRPAQIKAAIVAGAFVAAFWQLLGFVPASGLGEIVYRWVHESDWSHGPIIPLFSAYLVYLRWDEIKRSPVQYTWVGLALMLLGLGLYQYSLWGLKIGYARPVAMMICLLGVIIFLCGLPVLRQAWLPWLYLFFAIPIPRRYYFELTDPLQRLAAAVACGVLELVPGLHIERMGIMIHPLYHGQLITPLSVTDACSGMRSTMVLCALGTAVAFMTPRPWWQRVVLLGACVPIATLCNSVRVTTTCALHVFADPKYAEGTYHTALGLLVIVLATLLFLGLSWLLNHLVVEEPETPPAAQESA